MCGEKSSIKRLFSLYSGSPPHVRGKAGTYLDNYKQIWDHPRMCGEKTKKIP